MSHSPLPYPSDPEPPSAETSSATFPQSEAAQQPSSEVCARLRQALAADTHSPAFLLHAAAEAARVLTGAHGIAMALRTKSVIVCRARSGEMAPELGAPLNVESGISGECLRTASILVCHDAETDPRVDPDVCRAFGVRSIVVVPLRGPTGMDGILEAFSSEANAFGAEQINYLRELAEIAEAAYERECKQQNAPQGGASKSATAFLASLVSKDRGVANETFGEPSLKRRSWIVGVAGLAVVLTSAVVWLSWRDPTPEVAASPATTHPTATAADTAPSTLPVSVKPAKPQPGTVRQTTRPTSILQNAADKENVEGSSNSPAAADIPSIPEKTPPAPPAPAPALTAEPAPSVEVAVSERPAYLAGLASGSGRLPTLDAKVSQGVTQPTLIHKVDPVYPTQARALRLDGAVVLDVTIKEDGSVADVKLISGPPPLVSAAADAVRKWRYSPPLLSGKPVEMQRRITVLFKLPS